jgi:hypothetical protein
MHGGKIHMPGLRLPFRSGEISKGAGGRPQGGTPRGSGRTTIQQHLPSVRRLRHRHGLIEAPGLLARLDEAILRHVQVSKVRG